MKNKIGVQGLVPVAKRALSLFLSLVMILSVTTELNFSAYAQDNENLVASIEFIPVKPIEIFENSKGYWDIDEESGEKFYVYRDNQFEIGDELTVTDNNGEKTKYYYRGQGYTFSSENGDTIDVDSYADQWDNHWTIGSDNYLTLTYSGKQVQVPVTIIESPVASIEYSREKTDIIENTDGYLDEYDDENLNYYRYFADSFNYGDTLTVHYKDSTTSVFLFQWVQLDDVYSINKFVDVENGDNVIEQKDVLLNAYQFENHWTVGNTYDVTVEYAGATTTFPVTIIENPVASIEFTPVKPIEFVENTNGSWQTDEETGEKFFEYDFQHNYGDTLTVTDKDGNKTEYKYSRDWTFRNENGDVIEIESYSNQWSKHWTLGSDNYFTVSYSYKEVQVPVTITESPVVSIEYKTIKPIEILETGRAGFDNLNNGDILTVMYKDGTKKEYKHTENQYCVSSDGEEIELDRIDYEKGNDYFTISYMGKSVQVPVTVISVNNEISKATYVPAKKTYYENMSGRYHRDGYYKYNLSFNKGDKLSFEYPNGEKESYTYIVEKQDDDYREGFYSDKTGRVMPYYAQFKNNFSKNPWTVGKNTLNLTVYANEDGYKGEELIKTTAAIELVGVKNIQFYLKDDKPLIFYKGVDSFIQEDETGKNYEYYNIPWWEVFDKMDYALVTTADGKQEKLKAIPYASEGELTNEDYSMEIFFGNIKHDDGRQDETHWDIGNHKIRATYGNYSFEIPVKVVENPVASIEYTPIKPYIFVENTNGYMDFDWNVEKEYFYYNTPEIAEGDVLTVTNKDGSKVKYTAKTYYNEEWDYSTYEFFDENGNEPLKEVWSGSNQSASAPWKLGSDNFVEVNYMGVTAKVPVTIVKEGEVHIHSYTETVTAPTCTEKGYTTFTCECGDVYTGNWTDPTGHTQVVDAAVAPTCSKTGLTQGSHCSECGEILTAQQVVAKTAHTYDSGKVTKVATCTANGVKTYTCAKCKNTKTAVIKALGHKYTTKVVKPTYTSEGYTLHTCTRCKKSYKDKKTKKLVLKNTSISKIIAGKKAFTIKWKKQSVATGYQIQYSTSSKFKGAKTVTISKNKTTSKKISKLKVKKKYYVRIRTYKTVKVNGKNTKVYSGWSKVKTVKTK